MKNKGQRSFSLVEALLAMTILGVAISGILTAFSASMVAGRISQDYALAATMMEELKTHVRANLLSPLEVNEGTFTNHPDFSWQVQYFYTDMENLYQVNLMIAWVRGGRELTLNYTTYHYVEITEGETESTTSER